MSNFKLNRFDILVIHVKELERISQKISEEIGRDKEEGYDMLVYTKQMTKLRNEFNAQKLVAFKLLSELN
jgi:hypothetical protein